MRARLQSPRPSISGLWSLFWRAVIFTPFAIVFGVVWTVTWPLLFALPVFTIYLLAEKDWLRALAATGIWLMLFLLTRLRLFKTNRHQFPNDQENV